MRSNSSFQSLMICVTLFQLQQQIVTGTSADLIVNNTSSGNNNNNNNISDCVDTIGWKPFDSFPGCNDDSVLCDEGTAVMEHCCKCRCTSSVDQANNNIMQKTPCYDTTTPSIPTGASPTLPPSVLLAVPSTAPLSIPSGPEPTPPPTNYYENWVQNGGQQNEENPINRYFFLFFGIVFFVTLLRKGTQLRTNSRHRRYRAARAERLRRTAMQQEEDNNNNSNNSNMMAGAGSGADAARYERIMSKFYFQAVLPDQSNVNPKSLKSGELSPPPTDNSKDEDKDIESSIPKEEEGDSDETVEETEESTGVSTKVATATSSESEDSDQDESDDESKIHHHNSNNSNSSINTKAFASCHQHQHHHPSLCEVISSWASVSPVSPPSDVCCICLEVYSAGDTICVAKNPNCDHLFHKDCVLEWMKKNDECPLCRMNLLH